MAMGETGVASSRAGSAALFNPALLSANVGGETVSIILPNIGVSAFADPDAMDAFKSISDEDYLTNIDDALAILNDENASQADFYAAKKTFTDNTSAFSGDLADLSEQPVNVNAGGFFAVSFANETLGVSVYANTTAVVEAAPVIADCDQAILNKYIDVVENIDVVDDIADEYPATVECTNSDGDQASFDLINFDDVNDKFEIKDPSEELDSSVATVGVTVAEFGVALSHAFSIAGHKVSFGITPKFMQITSYYAAPTIQQVDDSDFDLADEVEDSKKEDEDFNIDLGVSTAFLSDSLTVGLVAKNVIAKTYSTSEWQNGSSVSFDIEPQLRAGVAWDAPLGFMLAADLDLIKKSLHDAVIEPQRAKLIPHFYDVKEAAINAGALGCSISGSGPSIFALSPNSKIAEEVGERFKATFSKNNISNKVFVSEINNDGAVLI